MRETRSYLAASFLKWEIRRNHLHHALSQKGDAGLLSLFCVIVILMALPAANLNLNAPRPKTLSTKRKSGESDGRGGMF
jgi:hypothetical protein